MTNNLNKNLLEVQEEEFVNDIIRLENDQENINKILTDSDTEQDEHNEVGYLEKSRQSDMMIEKSNKPPKTQYYTRNNIKNKPLGNMLFTYLLERLQEVKNGNNYQLVVSKDKQMAVFKTEFMLENVGMVDIVYGEFYKNQKLLEHKTLFSLEITNVDTNERTRIGIKENNDVKKHISELFFKDILKKKSLLERFKNNIIKLLG